MRPRNSTTSRNVSSRVLAGATGVRQNTQQIRPLSTRLCEVRRRLVAGTRSSTTSTPASLALPARLAAHASAVSAARRPMSRATALESGGGSGSALLLRLFESSFFDVHLAIG